jgi:tRNA threonylcarbamoyl adenosine modification protein (Sua5/YciO/YrdC/YwlC family)
VAQLFTLHPTHPQPRLIRNAANCLRDGGVLAYPTDSSYALGCALGQAEPARRILRIRGLGSSHYLSLVVPDLAALGPFVRLDTWQFRLVRKGVPGPYTFILPATREVPRRLQHPKRRTVGIRVPEHAVALALLRELGGPMLSSSLVLPGDDVPMNDATAIRAALEHEIQGIVDAGPCPAEPTTVIDLASDPPAITRVGRGDPARLGLAKTG